MWRWMGASQMVQGATWLVGVQKNETDLAAIVALTGCATYPQPFYPPIPLFLPGPYLALPLLPPSPRPL